MLLAHLRRGVLAGLVAGLAFGLLTALVANPLIGFADGLAHGEHGAHAAEAGHAGEASGAVSVGVTEAISVLSGALWGVLLGAVVFGAAFYLLEPAIPGTGATKSAIAAGAGFLTVSGAPWLVLPPAPPGAEQALAAGTRIQLYAGMMVAGALACLLAGLAYEHVRKTRGRPTALVAATPPLALLAVPTMLAPAPGTQHALPPSLAAALTGMIVLGQGLLWATMAGVHAWLSRSDRAASDTLVDGRSTDATVAAD